MTAPKMQVVILSKTKAVVCAATRRTNAATTVEDLAGSGLVVRIKGSEASVTVPAEELEVKEVDQNDEVFRNPLAHVVDGGTLVAAPAAVQSISSSAVKVTVALPATPPIPADKEIVVVIEAGANNDPLKFFGKTVAGVSSTDIPVTGIPPGNHLVLASVGGYATKVESKSFF